MSKSILVTGGSRGIGRAASILAGKRGWSVGVNFADNETAAKTTAKAVEAAGGRAILVRADVSIETDVTAMFGAVANAFEGLDGLVNNAGIAMPASPLADISVERLQRLLDVNVLGAYLCAREAARMLPRDRGGRGGSIVNVSSAAARLGGAGVWVDYAGSKGAIDTLTVGLSRELASSGVRVNAVRPGIIDTEIHASSGNPNRAAELGSTVPLGRAGTADEVAEAIIWLLSDEASYVTGAIIDVAGGR